MIVPLLVAVGLALAAGAAYRVLARVERRSPEAQAALERAVGAIDRELAANLELAAMFDQTHQAFVLENGEFAIHREAIARELPGAYADALSLYERIPETEAAMERRGPANSLADADRAIIERWEGDARALQRSLRDAAHTPPTSRWDRLTSRLRAR